MPKKVVVQEPIWAVWRQVTRAMPMRGMLKESFVAPSTWRMFGVDYISGLRLNASSQKLVDVLAPLSPLDLHRVHALAQINHKRHEAISRWYAIGFLTVPVSAALAMAQIAPEALEALRSQREAAGWTTLIVYFLAVVGFYLLAAWRARQVVMVIELAMVERGVLAASALEPDSELEAPLGT